MSGKLYAAVVIRRGPCLQFRCFGCKADLSESHVVREEQAGARTIYVVNCRKCHRFNTFYRSNNHANRD